MVTVLQRRRHGYDVIIFTDDHESPYVHVHRGGSHVRVYLDDLEYDDVHGSNVREIGRILRLIEKHMTLLQSEWVRLHKMRRRR